MQRPQAHATSSDAGPLLTAATHVQKGDNSTDAYELIRHEPCACKVCFQHLHSIAVWFLWYTSPNVDFAAPASQLLQAAQKHTAA